MNNSNERVKVFDDVFEQDLFLKISNYVKSLEYKELTGDVSYNDSAENPSQAERGCILPALPIDNLLPAELINSPIMNEIPLHPTGTPLDSVVEMVDRNVKSCEDIIGTKGKDWVAVVCTPYNYKSGERLAWHTDSEIYSGAFILYAHENWDIEWGGELLYSNVNASDIFNPNTKVDAEKKLKRLEQGKYINPLPNRLVVIGAGTPHKVSNVTLSAEDNMRVSVAGFFITPKGLDKFIPQILDNVN